MKIKFIFISQLKNKHLSHFAQVYLLKFAMLEIYFALSTDEQLINMKCKRFKRPFY